MALEVWNEMFSVHGVSMFCAESDFRQAFFFFFAGLNLIFLFPLSPFHLFLFPTFHPLTTNPSCPTFNAHSWSKWKSWSRRRTRCWQAWKWWSVPETGTRAKSTMSQRDSGRLARVPTARSVQKHTVKFKYWRCDLLFYGCVTAFCPEKTFQTHL